MSLSRSFLIAAVAVFLVGWAVSIPVERATNGGEWVMNLTLLVVLGLAVASLVLRLVQGRPTPSE
jgi:hypothetical protein